MQIVECVGIFTRLSGLAEVIEPADVTAAATDPVPAVDPSTFPIASPWSSSDMQRIVADDVFGSNVHRNTRSAAMSLPAVARARNLLVATISRLPLQALRHAEALPDDAQPTFLYRTGTGSSPQQRLAWTVDDLIFSGWSCWTRVNNADGFPRTADRLPLGSWSIDADNRVIVDGRPVPDDQVIIIPGLHEGVLSYGREALTDTRRLYEVIRDRLENPVPALDLHQTEGEDLTKEQREDLLESWRAARKAKGGAAVGYTNKAIEVNELGAGADSSQLLVEARNAASLDLARLIGVAASRIDSSIDKSSLNYETTTGRNQEFVDFDLALYLTPITARLSLDDVVPQGQRVAFDLSNLTGLNPVPTGAPVQD